MSIAEEFLTQTRQPNGPEVAWLRHRGVRARSPLTGSIRTGNIEQHKDYLFSFDPDGNSAFVHPVFDSDGTIYDLIGWKPSNPSRWWLRTGIATLLGETALNACYVHECPLRLYRTALNWLRRGGWGAVPLDWRSARLCLLDIRDFIAEDIQHGIEIEERLCRPAPPSPRIHVPFETRRAA